MASNTRPWQGTTLAVFDIIGTVLMFVFGLLLIFMRDLLTSIFSSAATLPQVAGTEQSQVAVTGALSMLGSIGLGIGIVLLGIGVLEIFMARGAFRGQKWSPIVSLIFSILAVINYLSNLKMNASLVGLVISALIIYCSIICIKDKFYNKA